MKNNNLIIALSGASHSGKTTFMNMMKNKYPDKVILLDEIIRDLDIGNIDDIRKNPIDYLELEFKIIKAKIDGEQAINKTLENKIVLIDRSLIDSYFYYTFYVDKSNLPEKYLIQYHEFLSYLYETMIEHVNNLYDITYFFEPITQLTRNDVYTQKNLAYTQINEYNYMLILTNGITNNYKKVNIIKDTQLIEKDILSRYEH